MLNLSPPETLVRQAGAEDWYPALIHLLRENASWAERVRAVENALNTPAGRMMRDEVGKWIVEQFVPVEVLVPAEYAEWRAPVRDAMLYVISHLSAARLAPKIVEQLEMPDNTSPETRLLRLIAKVPGLQKLGQVLARNRRLRPSLRNALAKLENGIHDVHADDMAAIVGRELGPRLDAFAVRLRPSILSEASVSAVMRFTWRNPDTGLRQRGVFKVLKPHIPACFAEDMDILQGLADHFGTRYREYGFGKRVLTDTFGKVRRLLQHEVDFIGEQKTLVEAFPLYRLMPAVGVPRVIPALCTPRITALSEEHGEKVTDAAARMPPVDRGHLAEQLIEALIAVPLFASGESSLFHADPHAGNVLYNRRTGELTLLDWALTERLSREQRRHLALLVFMVSLRDAAGTSREVEALSQHRVRRHSRQAKAIGETVRKFLNKIPPADSAGAVHAMRLLQQIASEGVRFPAALIMFSKVLFTLDGILEDVGGQRLPMALIMARYVLWRGLANGTRPGLPLTKTDWMLVNSSLTLYGLRLSIRFEELLLHRLLPAQPERSGPANPHVLRPAA